MNTISKGALVCAVTLFSAHVTYGMENNDKKPNLEDNQPEGPNKKAKTVSNAEIFKAAISGKVDFFEEHNGIDLTIKDKFGRTLLHLACRYGHIKIVKFIVETNPQLLKVKTYFGWFGKTPLHCACSYGHIEIVKFIVGKNPELLKEKDIFGFTPLYCACLNGHINLVEFIVEQDPELLKEKSNDGWTSLHLACSQKHTETIQFLLLYGADFNAVDKNRKKPLMLCKEETRRIICDYMEELVSLKSFFLLTELCKNNKIFAQKAAQFIMSLKSLKKQKPTSFTVPKPVIEKILKELALLQLMDGSIGELFAAENEINQLIQKWTTEDKNNNNN